MIALLLLLPPVRVRAGSDDGFRLDSQGNVILDSTHAAKEGISSLSFSLTVEPEDAAKVDFVFAGCSAEIVEARYHPEEKKMNIYMAGTDQLFADGTESLSVGRIVITGGDGKSGQATVGVEPDSLKFVYGTKLRPMQNVDIPEKVRVGDSGGPPEQTPSPTQPPAPTAPPSGAGGQGGTPSAGTPVPPVETPSPSPTPVPKKPASSQGGNSGPAATPKPTAPPREDGDGGGFLTLTPVPLDPEPPAQDDSEEEIIIVSFDAPPSDEKETRQESALLEELKLLAVGFVIAAAVTGTGAAVVVSLIRKP